jgi:hypothetical protein
VGTHAQELETRDDVLDKYLRARMRLRVHSGADTSPRARTCPRCGEHFEARFTDGNWTVCPFCWRYV